MEFNQIKDCAVVNEQNSSKIQNMNVEFYSMDEATNLNIIVETNDDNYVPSSITVKEGFIATKMFFASVSKKQIIELQSDPKIDRIYLGQKVFSLNEQQSS